jgi:uncharacterized protein YbjT (DUF2867 family)
MRILITGATGNVGIEVMKAIFALEHSHEIYAGVRGMRQGHAALEPLPKIQYREFDFDKTDQLRKYLHGIDVLFLLRPPYISDAEKYFSPLVDAARKEAVRHIVFLSVQGVEKSSIIPHYKIEKLIRKSGIDYTFLRPAYFMQNFTTTLKEDIVTNGKVYLPAGNAKFNLIDVKDVGDVAARILIHPLEHQNKAYDLTNGEQLDFKSMCATLSEAINRKIEFISPSLLAFYFYKRKEGIGTPFILVMIMLHYLPRFQKPQPTSKWVERLLGRKPASFSEFVEREKAIWT